MGYLATFVDENGDCFYGQNKPNVVKWIRSFANLHPTQKQEWSDFDAKMLARAMRAVNYFINNDDHDEANQCFSWLIALKDRIQPQPKQGWDEDDEAKIVKLKVFIAQCNGFNKANRKKAFDLIDSIKPRHTWKPSEKQMNALANACNGKMLYLDYLNSLYQDLKKLTK